MISPEAGNSKKTVWDGKETNIRFLLIIVMWEWLEVISLITDFLDVGFLQKEEKCETAPKTS